MLLSLVVVFALILDYLLAEPKRWHPLVGFGRFARGLELRINGNQEQPKAGLIAGVLAWCLAVLPWVWLASWLQQCVDHGPAWLQLIVSATVLYLALGWQSLWQHAMAVAYPLSQGNLIVAREQVAMMVSRDSRTLDQQGVAAAATESVLENGADAIFAALFWFLVLGIPGVVLYRLANTLDAMWGYKNTRYREFGWAAARIDDLLNFIPARLTALSYLLMGKGEIAWRCWQQQAGRWKSPNAGPVMAAGAGAINVRLGGEAVYHGVLQPRGNLGPVHGQSASAWSIVAACGLVNRSLVLWLGIIVSYGLFVGILC